MRLPMNLFQICELCDYVGRQRACVAIQFPVTFALSTGFSIPSVCLCPQHAHQFICGLRLEESYTVDTIQSDIFAEPDVREAVFGSKDNYRAFSRLFVGNTAKFRTHSSIISDALDLKDWRRSIKIRSTLDWSGMEYYEMGDYEHHGQKRTLTSAQVEDFTDFVQRYVESEPNFVWTFRGVNCPVYVALLNYQHDVFATYHHRHLWLDKYYWVVSTDPTSVSYAKEKIRSIEYNATDDDISVIANFQISLNDFDERAVTKLLSTYQNYPHTVPFFSSSDVERGETKFNIYTKILQSEIGLRRWCEDSMIFDYVV